jgi:hypothetical protein
MNIFGTFASFLNFISPSKRPRDSDAEDADVAHGKRAKGSRQQAIGADNHLNGPRRHMHTDTEGAGPSSAAAALKAAAPICAAAVTRDAPAEPAAAAEWTPQLTRMGSFSRAERGLVPSTPGPGSEQRWQNGGAASTPFDRKLQVQRPVIWATHCRGWTRWLLPRQSCMRALQYRLRPRRMQHACCICHIEPPACIPAHKPMRLPIDWAPLADSLHVAPV